MMGSRAFRLPMSALALALTHSQLQHLPGEKFSDVSPSPSQHPPSPSPSPSQSHLPCIAVSTSPSPSPSPPHCPPSPRRLALALALAPSPFPSHRPPRPHRVTLALAVASSTPLQFEFYLSDSESKLLLTNPEGNHAAQAAAAKLRLPQATASLLEPSPVNIASFRILFETGVEREPSPNISAVSNESSDEAHFLHTSGTTSQPKGVPLTQFNLSASVQNIKSVYRLTESESTVVVLPLFHVHGLLAGLLNSLGAATFVALPTPGRYIAVPTIHQILLDRHAAKPKPAYPQLRFIRSYSAALVPVILERLERAFGTPVLESYVMIPFQYWFLSAHPMRAWTMAGAGREQGVTGDKLLPIATTQKLASLAIAVASSVHHRRNIAVACIRAYLNPAKIEIAKTFQEKGIPCDVIWMDIDYMDGFRCFTFDKMISTTSSSLNCSHRPSDANIRYDIDAQLRQYTANLVRVVRTVSMLWAKPMATTMTSEAVPNFWMRRASSRAILQKLFTATIYSNKGFHRRRIL
ncbi:hypothetical protein Taro_045250 [Colocasia esculenta]|uniref:4-coumarate--CoA ligase n=1 Tax=Colocasia esculenta TaxID=4460 RepID=A0A843X2D7_COLES|nr:hypothetical protein [Colocasia esculenta]